MQEDIVIDCSSEQLAGLKACLDNLGFRSSLPDLYWLPVPDEFLNDLQQEHKEDCGPYAMALELSGNSVTLEMLVRAQNQLHCACIALADEELAQHMHDYVSLLLSKKLKV
ncbi:MAG: hypothetical protein IJD04_02260 [Desulfovibrionaceae bacterium]|nr:hypothetical protein [Desulfovibrionaceae bacterium]